MDRTAAITALVVVALVPVSGYVAASLLPGAAGFVVGSGSMEPAIDSGSLVYVQETNDYEPGDVVTFRVDDRIVTHRVVDETSRGYVTRGDANDAPDDWRVGDDQIVGEVVLAVPLYGSLLAFVGTPVGYALVVALPAAALIALEVRDVLGRILTS